MIEALKSEFKRLEAGLESRESAIAKSKENHTSPDAETEKSLEFMSHEYDELNNFRANAKQKFSALNTRLSELTENVDKISSAIYDLEQYSYSYNVKLIGIPESGRRESAIETSTACANLFKEIGADITIQDIDIAHRVPTKKRGSPSQ
jgi:predicted  nucleic acid-binding Zn-ribbon protein